MLLYVHRLCFHIGFGVCIRVPMSMHFFFLPRHRHRQLPLTTYTSCFLQAIIYDWPSSTKVVHRWFTIQENSSLVKLFLVANVKAVMLYIRHGDDQVTMFNAKCQLVVLTNHIKKVLNIPRNAVLDLIPCTADPKLMIPAGLADKGDVAYANTFFPSRSTFALMTVKEDEDNVKEFTLLWNSSSTMADMRDKLAAAVDARNAEEKKKSAAAKGGKGAAGGKK